MTAQLALVDAVEDQPQPIPARLHPFVAHRFHRLLEIRLQQAVERGDDPTAADFRLDLSGGYHRCARCLRRLTDPISLQRGVGPTCATKVAR